MVKKKFFQTFFDKRSIVELAFPILELISFSKDSLKDAKSSDELRDRLEIPDLTEMLRKNRLRWFEHVMRMDAGNSASACRQVMVEGKREQGRPKKHGPN